jgi:hypothetical protein
MLSYVALIAGREEQRAILERFPRHLDLCRRRL